MTRRRRIAWLVGLLALLLAAGLAFWAYSHFTSADYKVARLLDKLRPPKPPGWVQRTLLKLHLKKERSKRDYSEVLGAILDFGPKSL